MEKQCYQLRDSDTANLQYNRIPVYASDAQLVSAGLLNRNNISRLRRTVNRFFYVRVIFRFHISLTALARTGVQAGRASVFGWLKLC